MKYSRIKKSILGLLFVCSAFQSGFAQSKSDAKSEFFLLPYAYNALEPYIDAQTVEIHYGKHHRSYYDKFIKSIAGTEYEGKRLEDIFASISKAPTGVRNAGGGYYNHNLYWSNLSPTPGSISIELKTAIEGRFGSIDSFKEAFNKESATVFGSGWAWLIVTDKGRLEIVSTPNQDNPLMDVVAVRGTPLLAIDVWEHAYYLKYQNRRADYILVFWNLVDWGEMSRRYTDAIKE